MLLHARGVSAKLVANNTVNGQHTRQNKLISVNIICIWQASQTDRAVYHQNNRLKTMLFVDGCF